METRFRSRTPKFTLHLSDSYWDINQFLNNAVTSAGYDLSNFVYSITSLKSTRGGCTANIVLTPSVNSEVGSGLNDITFLDYWDRLIKPMNIISFEINRNNKNQSFLGMVDEAHPSILVNNNSTKRVFEINCTLLLQKILLRDQIKNSSILLNDKRVIDALGKERASYFNWFKMGKGLTDDGKNIFLGSPEVAIDYILTNMPAANTKILQGNGKVQNITDFYDPKKCQEFTFLKNDSLFLPELTIFEGNILNYIKSCYDSAFYETFFKTFYDGNRPLNKIVIRPLPFSYKSLDDEATQNNGWKYWEDLERVEIDSSYRIQDDTGMSDYETKNYFQVNFINNIIAQPDSTLNKFGYNYPVINLDSVKEFGLRPISANSIMMQDWTKIVEWHNKIVDDERARGTGSYTGVKNSKEYLEFIENSNKYLWTKREKLVQWFSFPYFKSGPMTIMDNENYDKENKIYNNVVDIGKVLYFKDKKYHYQLKFGDEIREVKGVGMEYYIDWVQERYTYQQPFTITMGLTRGQPKGLVPEWIRANRANWVDTKLFENTIVSPPVTIDPGEVIQKRNMNLDKLLEFEELH